MSKLTDSELPVRYGATGMRGKRRLNRAVDLMWLKQILTRHSLP